MSASAGSCILGTGIYVPPTVVTNHDLAARMPTSDEWIQQRTGIKQRHFSTDGEGPAYLATEASKAALEDACCSAEDVDLILLATLSPEHVFPGTACFVQERLGIEDVPCMDLRNQCTGFLYGLATADAFIRSGSYQRVLLIGTEVHSTGLDFSEEGRDVAVLFGDGAGAWLLGPADGESPGLFSVHLHADGRFAKELWLSHPSSAQFPVRIRSDQAEGPGAPIFPQMNGRTVFKHAVRRMEEAVHEALEANSCSLDDVDCVVPHQANKRINELLAKRLEVPDSKIVHSIEFYGNTTAASIPMAFEVAREEGRIDRGSIVLLVAFGSGFTWGSALLRY